MKNKKRKSEIEDRMKQDLYFALDLRCSLDEMTWEDLLGHVRSLRNERDRMSEQLETCYEYH